MQRIMKISSLLLCLCLVFGLAACGDGVEQKEESQKLKIVCTLFPQYDFTRQLVGDKAEVTLLLTPGTDSHSYDPSPVDMVKINGSDLFIYTGPLMEGWAAEVVGTLNESVAVLSLAEGKRLKENTDVYSSHVEEDHDHSADPHIWTSPVNAMLIVQEICDKICEADPENAVFYRGNEEEYLNKLEELDSAIRAVTDKAENKTIVMCDRFALIYFCEEYSLDYIAAFDACTSNTEPSPAVIVEITKTVQNKNIPAVFCAELSNRKVAQAVSAQTGAQVLKLHSCHNLSADDFNAGETYLSLMYKNADNLKIALGVN
ncbi:MAG: zinc ABC transporter substrate-binding protein [Clostridia bacterium]|nr:zinc ABC transporter substrate-binding protein [Clostridia bacterium]